MNGHPDKVSESSFGKTTVTFVEADSHRKLKITTVTSMSAICIENLEISRGHLLKKFTEVYRNQNEFVFNDYLKVFTRQMSLYLWFFNVLSHTEESSENTCDFGELKKNISPFTMVVNWKTDFEA